MQTLHFFSVPSSVTTIYLIKFPFCSQYLLHDTRVCIPKLMTFLLSFGRMTSKLYSLEVYTFIMLCTATDWHTQKKDDEMRFCHLIKSLALCCLLYNCCSCQFNSFIFFIISIHFSSLFFLLLFLIELILSI